MSDLDKARVWAESVFVGPASPRAHAAAKIIQSLPDRWVDAEKVREVTDRHNDLIVDFLDQIEGDMNTDTWEAIRDFMCELNVEVDALSIPKPPTLADMTAEEQKACVGMQADYSPLGEPVKRVAIMGITEFGAILMSQNWEHSHREAGRITPLSDLPKLEWPGNEAVEPPALPEGMRLADHTVYGRVVVSPKPDDYNKYRVFYSNDNSEDETGASWRYINESRLTFLDGEA